MAGRLGKIAMNYFETDKAGYDALLRAQGHHRRRSRCM